MRINASGIKILTAFNDDLTGLDAVEKALTAILRPGLTENQFSALASFANDIGVKKFEKTDIRKLVNTGCQEDMIAAANILLDWHLDGDTVDKDLLRRRKRERKLFLTPNLVSNRGKNAV